MTEIGNLIRALQTAAGALEDHIREAEAQSVSGRIESPLPTEETIALANAAASVQASVDALRGGA